MGPHSQRAIDPVQSSLHLASGETRQYDRLLIATGAAPMLPPVHGLINVPFHVLRSMDDAINLRQAMGKARSAIVLGAGLIGMHAVENMAKAKIAVTVVELQPHALSGYFEPRASAIIERTFARNGVRMLMGQTLRSVERQGEGTVSSGALVGPQIAEIKGAHKAAVEGIGYTLSLIHI